MQQIKCDNCGNVNFVKVEDIFICNACGTTYENQQPAPTNIQINNFYQQPISKTVTASSAIPKTTPVQKTTQTAEGQKPNLQSKPHKKENKLLTYIIFFGVIFGVIAGIVLISYSCT